MSFVCCFIRLHRGARLCAHRGAASGVHYIGGNVGKPYAPLRRIFDAVTNFGVDWARISGARARGGPCSRV